MPEEGEGVVDISFGKLNDGDEQGTNKFLFVCLFRQESNRENFDQKY